MPLKNTPEEYGSVSKFFHWSLLILVLIQLFTIFWTHYVLPEKSPEIAFYIGQIHKPVGMLTFIVVVLALIWRAFNPHPAFPLAMRPWEKMSARLVHGLLYLGLIVMPLSGLIMSVAAGHPPNFFGLFEVPMFIEKNDDVAHFFFSIHEVSAFVLVALVGIHTLAALKHHFYDKDNVLTRMLPRF